MTSRSRLWSYVDEQNTGGFTNAWNVRRNGVDGVRFLRGTEIRVALTDAEGVYDVSWENFEAALCDREAA